ncbi:hypothetical protein E1B28_011097 [Marasmius oreades]|uniref:Arrestin-like N-terminal domain-containing protein n=1 Tax=Marasmius oreades TaxID=181124 RepID=A0A9P7RTD1_9AGAR|nr:uncharacterized protein E1B28_011097 [Marasmius oreades]KAG7089409.1 hypothetical protein E1B28_011097 [Marasmius oreades]
MNAYAHFLPPPYIEPRTGQVPSSGTETLPRYTRRNTIAQPLIRREPIEHVFQLVDGRRAWAILKLYSSAKSAKSIPTFYEKEKITGTLEIDAVKGDSSIRIITIEITGRITTSPKIEDNHTFLTVTHTIWSKSSDVVRVPSASESATGSKLVGRCAWPFSIPLPRKAKEIGGDVESHPLPETFRESDVHASVQYEVTVHVARGKLRTDNWIRAPFAYVPSSRPGLPSELRRLACEHNAPVPGPDVDPLGWSLSQGAVTRGLVFRSREAEVHCSLSLANPLCYTRGSTIPCFLKLSSRDSQALDWISNPNSIQLNLRRSVKYCVAATFGRTDIAWKKYYKDICTASWRPSRTIPSDTHNWYLEGEIKLPKDLKPSSKIGYFDISYSVDLCPFDLTGFQSSEDVEFLLSQPVEIVTMHPKASRHVSYSPPPAYDYS